jgi:hypothetical protein
MKMMSKGSSHNFFSFIVFTRAIQFSPFQSNPIMISARPTTGIAINFWNFDA